MIYDQIYKAWQAVGADIAGLKWDDFVKALAEQPAQQEPVGYWPEEREGEYHSRDSVTAYRTPKAGWIPVYTSPQPAQPQQEPFGYFKAEPFGWTDCAATDEGAVALYEHPPAQRKPLTGGEIREIADKKFSVYSRTYESYNFYKSDLVRFVRAIEAAHGIKENI